ncbi:MAG: hypothetical protein ACOYN5_06585 [Bacteroidales bacterium]
MEQQNLLERILSQLHKLEDLTKSIASQPDAIYRMDIEYLKQNTVQLYDLLHQLHPYGSKTPDAVKQAGFQKSNENQQPIKPIQAVELIIEEHNPLPVEDYFKEDEILEEIEIQEDESYHPYPEENLMEDVEEEEQEAIPDIKVLHHTPSVTTIDLFGDTIVESLGEKFAATDDHSIAAKMQQKRIHDLRAAIGINEKFLFINELFGGNLNQYNKTIDELNNMVSLDGARAFLIELRIQHQWPAQAPALLKLNDLIERKFRTF